MNDSVVITYSGQQVSVPKEVADFLEQDRKREQAQEKRDQRHLSRSEFETVLFCSDCVRRPVEDAALRNLSWNVCGMPSMTSVTKAGIWSNSDMAGI